MIGKKVLTKIVLLLIVLFGVTILTFVYTNLSPVDAAEALALTNLSSSNMALGCGMPCTVILEIHTTQDVPLWRN